MNSPATIDGIALIASTIVRSGRASHPPISLRKIAVPMPIGTLSAVANLHTGWPTTTLTLVPSNAPNAVDGVVAVPGPRDAERLSPTRRVDFRASRSFALGLGTVRVFAEVTNITDRDNVCCVQYRQAATPPNEAPALEMDMRGGLPSTVNFGALWEF